MVLRKHILRAIGTVGTGNESNRACWLRETLREIPAGAQLLDAGAGTQRNRKYCSHLRYLALDFGRYDGRGDGRGLQVDGFNYGQLDVVGDVVALPVVAGSFDAVLCTEVLEHLPTPELAIKEFSRVVRNGGHLVLTAPFFSLTHYAPFHFATGFDRYFYEHVLPRHQFEIVDLRPNGSFFDVLAQELIRLDGVARQYTGQPLHRRERILVGSTAWLANIRVGHYADVSEFWSECCA
jgi:SAM-dependent methyltransferase